MDSLVHVVTGPSALTLIVREMDPQTDTRAYSTIEPSFPAKSGLFAY